MNFHFVNCVTFTSNGNLCRPLDFKFDLDFSACWRSTRNSLIKIASHRMTQWSVAFRILICFHWKYVVRRGFRSISEFREENITLRDNIVGVGRGEIFHVGARVSCFPSYWSVTFLLIISFGQLSQIPMILRRILNSTHKHVRIMFFYINVLMYFILLFFTLMF